MRNAGLVKGLVFLLVTFVCAGCVAQEPYVRLNGQKFTVEIAETSDKQQLGLMFRDSMPEDHGMLFIFPTEAMRSFWMKNTRIPLDIFYFDADFRLVSVVKGARPCRTQQCPAYPSKGPAKYVLELNAGLAEQLGTEPGDPLEFKR
ncbi:MAG: DUF192 domain-containing protein [Xanthomonadales bacterium]|nr:DUF192 domain-containing protein [Xanthomonadales bacterium]